MEGGSHHITEEELWLEQKALKEGEGGHITSLWLGQKALREGEKHHIAREGLVSHV